MLQARLKIAMMSDVQLHMAYELACSELDKLRPSVFKSRDEFLQAKKNGAKVCDMLRDEIDRREYKA